MSFHSDQILLQIAQVAVLQNKQSLPVSAQLDVVKAADFSGLPVVAYIEEHTDEKTPLVELALKFLDGKDTADVFSNSELEWNFFQRLFF